MEEAIKQLIRSVLHEETSEDVIVFSENLLEAVKRLEKAEENGSEQDAIDAMDYLISIMDIASLEAIPDDVQPLIDIINRCEQSENYKTRLTFSWESYLNKYGNKYNEKIKRVAALFPNGFKDKLDFSLNELITLEKYGVHGDKKVIVTL
jgi:hypothetical protein